MIDILLAAYNGERFLPFLLDSLRLQTEQNYRILWHDDGSKDQTVALLSEESRKDPRFSCPSHTVFQSSASSFFDLLSFSTAEYAMFCDQDDTWHPDKVEKTLQAMQQAEKRFGTGTPILVHTDLIVTDENGKTIASSFMALQHLEPRKDSLSRLLCQSLVTGCTVMINAALRELLLRQLPEKCLMHDWWMSLLAAAKGKIIYLPEQTIDYRQHGGNVVGAKKVDSLSYVLSKLMNIEGMRSSLNNSYLQAADFYRCFEDILSPQDAALIKQYSSLPELPFVKRRQVALALGTIKCGTLRAIAQLILL